VHIRRFWISKINKMQDDRQVAAEQQRAKTSIKKPKVVKSPL
jgi:hypothetical protein